MTYEYRYVIDQCNGEELNEVLEWCYENFGYSKDYDTFIKHYLKKQLVDDTNEKRWTYMIGTTNTRVLFTDEIDATAFKLRWVA